MAPNDRDAKETSAATRAGAWLASPPPGEEVVVSGLAGVYPNSDNVYQLRDNLMNKVDMVSADNRRWDIEKNQHVPARFGKLNDISRFDASFFGVHPKQGDVMDPQARILLEKTYEAIVDAGLNPADLSGTRTAVIIGCCYVENDIRFFNQPIADLEYGMMTSSRASFATRISFWLKVNGPSYMVDAACSSGSYAIDAGYKAIRDGDCDQAIVAAGNLCTHPTITSQFVRLGVLNMDGRCMAFDEEAQGYCRSEAISVILLQKANVAKRIYATIVHSKTNCDGYKDKGITYPSGEIQQKLLEEFYEECQVDPASVAWIEAHGTGTKVGDPEECAAIDAVFCKDRSTPLPIGSVKSNIGHTEPVSGLCSLAKVIIAMETGVIPPNIHYNTPKKSIPALTSGRLQVVSEPQPWGGGLVAFNSFGFGGANCHILLRSHNKEKRDGGAPSDGIPRLVAVSGRTELAVKQILDDLASRPVDVEYIRLLHDVNRKATPGHDYRGFTVLQQTEVRREIQYVDKVARPLWLVFSGLDSQWRMLGRELKVIPAFSKVIDECHQTLLPQGLDMREIIAEFKPRNQIHRCVGVTAIQIGLVEVLRTVGVEPDGLIGHHVGELAAAFAANCLTLQQAVMTSYYLGVALHDAETKSGTRTGIYFDSAQGMLVPESSNPETPQPKKHPHIVAQGKHIGIVRDKVVNELMKVVSSSQPCNVCWLSHISRSAKKQNKMATADYFADIIFSQGKIQDVFKEIPKNAVIVDVSPNNILAEVLPTHVSRVSVFGTQRHAVDQLVHALGKLYLSGMTLNLAPLYPEVSLPVSRGTPMLSPHIGWEHSRDVFLVRQGTYQNSSRDMTVEIDLKKEDNQFYSGHVVDGRNLFPATGYIWMVAVTLAKILMLDNLDHVIFENIHFVRATNLPKDGIVQFRITIQKVSSHFEVVESGSLVVSGRISVPRDITKEMVDLEPRERPQRAEGLEMKTRDIYKELKLRGYNYSGLFRSIVSSTPDGERAKIRWSNNWPAFMDNLLQLSILATDSRGLFVPTSIDRIAINKILHDDLVASRAVDGQDTVLDVMSSREANVVRCGGIEIRGLHASPITRRKALGEPVLESYQFLPYKDLSETRVLHVEEVLRVCVHVALENQSSLKVKAVELVDEQTCAEKQLLAPVLLQILEDLPLMQPEVTVLSPPDHPLTSHLGSEISVQHSALSSEVECMLVLGTNLLGRPRVLESALGCVGLEGFLISREMGDIGVEDDSGLQVLSEYRIGDEIILLLRKNTTISSSLVIDIKEDSFEWVPHLQARLKSHKSEERILLVAQHEPMNGILGLFNCLRREPGGDGLRCFFILDENAPRFDLELPLYKKQLVQDLAVNVYKDGCWGSYRHLRLADNPMITAPHAYASILTSGDLASFRWIEGSLRPNQYVEPDSELIYCYYSALNFRDVMTAAGKLAVEVFTTDRMLQDSLQGFEYSGRTSTGRRVMGLCRGKGISNMLIVDKADFQWEVPDEWSLEDAATVPIVYATAYYALCLTGRMARGDSVLIHAGSGGVGQAAINIALHAGCTVFTTVGTQEKRDFIKQTFPQLTDRHIGNSRDTSFEQQVMAETNGRGVDLVLNSLAEEKLQASVRCLAVGGRFLEIGKSDLANNNPLGMNSFLKETSFHGVMLDNLNIGSIERKTPLVDLLTEGIRSGAVRPLTRTLFKKEEVENAFRFMAAGKHIGKVIIKIRPEEEVSKFVQEPFPMQALPRFVCNPQFAYILAGGLGGFGLELGDWLVLRGVRQLVLTSRTGVSNGYQSSRVNIWRSYGVTVVVSTDDVTTEAGVTSLLHEANTLGPVAAIFNLAVVLADALFENQTPESFAKCLAPKADATRHLDVVSRRLCPQLSHFVVFSSVSCGRGNAGQTNYGMANSVMERICEKRVSEGYPGLAVQWGAVGDVGLVADKQEENQELVIGGTLQQKITSCLKVLDGFLRQQQPVVASMVVAEKSVGLSGSLLECVANILGIRDVKTFSYQATLAEQGMDSMSAVEIKQILEREYQVFLTPKELRALTFAKIIEFSEARTNEATESHTDENIDVTNLFHEFIGEESSTTEKCLVLPSLVDNVQAPTLFMVPGIESLAQVFASLASNLRCRAVALQLGFHEEGLRQSLQEMAESLLPHVISSLTDDQPFLLLGYSYGSLVALHLARLLEATGRTGTLLLVDGSPEFLWKITRAYASDDDTTQISLLLWIADILENDRDKKRIIGSEVRGLTTWEERLQLVLSLMPESNHSRDYISRIYTSALNKIRRIDDFCWPENERLRSQVTLLRPEYPALRIERDYGLSKYCEAPPETTIIEASHRSILGSPLVADFINNRCSLE